MGPLPGGLWSGTVDLSKALNAARCGGSSIPKEARHHTVRPSRYASAGRSLISTLFLDPISSARKPFRLGPPMRTDEHSADGEAVDLHVGQRLRFDITTRWLRVYLFDGGCGNTVARLASNLQHHFDGALSIVDDQLNASLKPGVNA